MLPKLSKKIHQLWQMISKAIFPSVFNEYPFTKRKYPRFKMASGYPLRWQVINHTNKQSAETPTFPPPNVIKLSRRPCKGQISVEQKMQKKAAPLGAEPREMLRTYSTLSLLLYFSTNIGHLKAPQENRDCCVYATGKLGPARVSESG